MQQIPTVYLIQLSGVSQTAGLKSGDKLIHTATGGLAYQQNFAKSVGGVTVYATAGTPEKRAYLAELGESVYL